MRILACLGLLLLNGCAHQRAFMESTKSVELIPDHCDASYCNVGKPATWEDVIHDQYAKR